MRILHVVTWVAPGNPFGGPVTVAQNLTRELQARGHEVLLIGGSPSGTHLTDKSATGVPQHLFPGYRLIPTVGFSGLISPGLWWWVLRQARSFDVVHIHVSRDLIALPAALTASMRGLAIVLQPHGMVDSSSRFLSRVVDALLTRRTFRRAQRTLALTPRERDDITSALGIDASKIRLLPNGVPLADASVQAANPNVVPDVLFCSRLHPRKNAVLFARVSARLIAAGVPATFTISGPDEGQGSSVDEVVSQLGSPQLVRTGAMSHVETIERLARCDLLVLPSVDEPYPMIVLEAMSLGKPVIVTDSCGLAGFVERHSAGAVVEGGSEEALAKAISYLLDDATQRTRMGSNARRAVRAELAIDKVVLELERVYDEALGLAGSKRGQES